MTNNMDIVNSSRLAMDIFPKDTSNSYFVSKEQRINRALFYDYGVEVFVKAHEERLGCHKCIFLDEVTFLYKDDKVYLTEQHNFSQDLQMIPLDITNDIQEFNELVCSYEYFRLHITSYTQTMISCELNDGGIKEIPYGVFNKFTKYVPNIYLNISTDEFKKLEGYYQVFVLFSMFIKEQQDIKFHFEVSRVFDTLFDALGINYSKKVENGKELYFLQTIDSVVTIFFSNFPDSPPLYIDELTFRNKCKNASSILSDNRQVHINIDAPSECNLETLFHSKVGETSNYKKRGITDSFPIQSYDKVIEICDFFGIDYS